MPRTIDEGFNTFLSWLRPLAGEHAKGRSHRDSVKRCLANWFGLYKLIETGSFGNGTGIRHHSDTDYFAILNAANVSTNSATALRRLKEGLKETFSRTEGIEVNSPAVSIPFGKYRSETLEITPCVYAGMINKHPAYRIPDGMGGWLLSSPLAHKQYVRHVDTRLHNKLKPLIQLVKAWKYFNKVAIKSFYLELFITSCLSTRRRIDLPSDLSKIFQQLLDNELNPVDDPMGVSGLIPATNTERQLQTALSKVATAASRAAKAVEQAKKSNIDQAFKYWNLLFNKQFPAR